jgi:general secretion pathway protein F
MRFKVRTLSSSGTLGNIEIEAADADDATRRVSGDGSRVLSLRPVHGLTLKGWQRRRAFPLMLFNQELLALLRAGLALVEAIDALAEKEPQPANRAVLARLREKLHEGTTLSQAMQEQSHAFPALYVASVRATERTGDLPDALTRYAAYQEQVDYLRRKVVGASIYPVMLMITGGLVLLFLLAYVVPKFSLVYADIKAELPLASRILLKVGGLVSEHGLVIFSGAGAMLVLVVYFVSRKSTREMMARWLWTLPSVGERIRVYRLARFYRTMGMLVRGGIPILGAMEMAAGLLGLELRAALGAAANAVREGRPLSQAMQTCGLATPVGVRMLAVGERSGQMQEMMEHIAAFYEQETARWVEWFTRLFEPLLMVVIGVMIGAIVVLMYLPVFELAGNIQ